MSGTISGATARRIARHDMRQHGVRTILTALIVAVPVFLGCVASLLLSPTVEQSAVPQTVFYSADAQLGDLIERETGSAVVAVERGTVDAVEVGRELHAWAVPDLKLLDSQWPGIGLIEGGWPTGSDDVVVTDACACGLTAGSTVTAATNGVTREFRVTGVARVDTLRDTPTPELLTGAGTLGTALAPLALADASAEQTMFIIPDMGDAHESRPVARDAGAIFDGRGNPWERLAAAASSITLVPGLVRSSMSFGQGLANFITFVVVASPTLILIALIIGLMVSPSFTITAQSSAQLLRRLHQNGANSATTRRVLGTQGLLVGAVGVAVGLAAFAAGVFALAYFITETVAVPIDAVALVVAFTLLSTWLAAATVARRSERGTVRRGEWTARRVNTFAINGVGCFVVAALIWMYLAVSRRLDLVTPMVAAVLLVTGVVLVAPKVLLITARLSRSWGFAWRFAGREVLRSTGRAVPVFSTLATVTALFVAALMGAANIATQEVISPMVFTAPSEDAAREAATDFEEATPLNASALQVLTSPDARGVLRDPAFSVPGNPAVGVVDETTLNALVGGSEDFDAAAYAAGLLALVPGSDSPEPVRQLETADGGSFTTANDRALDSVWWACCDVMVSPAGLERLPESFTRTAEATPVVLLHSRDAAVTAEIASAVHSVRYEHGLHTRDAGLVTVALWAVAGVFFVIVTFFVGLVLTLLCRQLGAHLRVAGALGASARALRRVGTAQSLIITTPAVVLGAVVGGVLYTLLASAYSDSGWQVIRDVRWAPIGVGAFAIIPAAAAISWVATRVNAHAAGGPA